VLRETTSRGRFGLEAAHHALVKAGEREIVWKKEGEERGAREGACTGAAGMTQPSTLRLILNAATLAAASPTLPFSD
jgi:hypothetical protein